MFKTLMLAAALLASAAPALADDFTARQMDAMTVVADGQNGKPVYNFRSEGREFASGRCLIPADGFYEFTGPADKKKSGHMYAGLHGDNRFHGGGYYGGGYNACAINPFSLLGVYPPYSC